MRSLNIYLNLFNLTLCNVKVLTGEMLGASCMVVVEKSSFVGEYLNMFNSDVSVKILLWWDGHHNCKMQIQGTLGDYSS